MRRLDLRPVEARYDDDIAFTFRRLTLPDLMAIVRGTAMEAAIMDGGTVDMDGAEAIEVALRLVDNLATGWTLADHDGVPMPVTRAAVAALITEEPPLLEWLIATVMAPAVEAFSAAGAEKNASALSPNGATAGARTTARRARKPARPARAS